MKKNWSIILHSLSFVICTALAVYALYYIISVRHLNVEYTPTFTEESAQSLDNPYRGFYLHERIYSFRWPETFQSCLLV